jgi:hypothetical protein
MDFVFEIGNSVGLLTIALDLIDKSSDFLLFCGDICQTLTILSFALA